MSYHGITEDAPDSFGIFSQITSACSGNTRIDWFPNPEPYWPSKTVMELCARCQVRQQCLEWAVANDAHGFWGGTSRKQRKEWEERGTNQPPASEIEPLHEPEVGSVVFYRKGCRCPECLEAQAIRIRKQRARRAQRQPKAGQ